MGYSELNINSPPALNLVDTEVTDIAPSDPELTGPASILTAPYVPEADILQLMEMNPPAPEPDDPTDAWSHAAVCS